MNFREYKQKLRGLRKQAMDIRYDPPLGPMDPKCPKCGSPMIFRSDLMSGMWPNGAWECTNQRCWHMIPPGELAPDTIPDDFGPRSAARRESMRTKCRYCGSEIETALGAEPPGTYQDAEGTPDNPRAPGDYDNVCEICNYRDHQHGDVLDAKTDLAPEQRAAPGGWEPEGWQ